MFFLWPKSADSVYYDWQYAIHDTVKLAVRPEWRSGELVFNITAETTQNPVFLNTPLDQISYVSIGDETLTPVAWQVIDKTDYTLTGVLHMPALAQAPMTLGLVLYTNESVSFSWERTPGLRTDS